ncbi:hypothetical protein [Yersinia phage vB_Yru_GN1]|uniref:Uncharacterized protein n=1 Tax=Yersinia phage vB_Yru_GN1 TaxID=3074381 RepID=A0AA86MC24_9CAUD|nr:hypothetical protein [Yersinia phage vB_Yru_GN1]
MNIKESVQKPTCEGFLKVERILKDGTVQQLGEEQNLVVNMAANILRDLMFGDDQERIIKMHFGDMNLGPTDDTQNVAAPNLTDTALINKLYEKNVDKSSITRDGHPAIAYSVVLETDEFNGSGSQLITEYALATSTDRIFSRKTRAAVYKDSESSLKFTWTLVFS